MSLLVTEAQAEWADTPNTLSCHISGHCPEPQTSATCLLFSGRGLLSVQVSARGWDIPGGHIEAGETALEAVVREVREEAGVNVEPEQLTLYGYTRLELTCDEPENYKYPYPVTYQPVYIGFVKDLQSENLATEVVHEITAVQVLSFKKVKKAMGTRSWYPIFRHWLTAGK